MNVLLARPTSVSRRHKALKSAASALAMLAVGGVLSPALAEDWYWVGGNAGDLQDEANWAVGSRAGGNPDYLTAPDTVYFERDVLISNRAGVPAADEGMDPGKSVTFNITANNKVTLNFRFGDDQSNPSSIKVASGTLILTQNNTYTGTTTIDAGATLQLGTGVDGTGKIQSQQITNHGRFVINHRRQVLNNAPVFETFDAGSVTRTTFTQGTGIFSLLGGFALRMEKAFSINQHMITVGGQIVNGAKSGSILEIADFNSNNANNGHFNVRVVSVGGLLHFNNANELNIDTTITNFTPTGQNQPVAGDVVKKGAGLLNLTGEHTYTGTTTIQAGTLKLVTANAITNSSLVKISTGGTLWMGGVAQSFKSLLLDGGTLQGGSVTITGQNENGIKSNGGTLKNVAGGADLYLNLGAVGAVRTTTLVSTDANQVNRFGLITVQSYALLQVNSTTDTTADVIVAENGDIRIGDADIAGFLNANINNGGTVTLVNLTGDFNKVISDNGNFKGSLVIDSGNRVITLDAVQSFTGATTLKSGTLNLSQNGSLSNDSEITISGGTLDLNGHTQASTKLLTITSGILKNGTFNGNISTKGGTVDSVTQGNNFTLEATTGKTVITGSSAIGSVTVKRGAELVLYNSANETLRFRGLTVELGGR